MIYLFALYFVVSYEGLNANVFKFDGHSNTTGTMPKISLGANNVTH